MLVVLVSVLFGAVLVAHYFAATSVESGQSTASHCLVAVPVPLSVARRSVFQSYLAVHSRTKRISIFSSKTVHVSGSDDDWLRILMVHFLASLVWLVCGIASVDVSHDWTGLGDLFIVSSGVKDASVG